VAPRADRAHRRRGPRTAADDVEATLRAFVDRRFERCKLVVEQSVARTRGIIDPTRDFDVAAFERRVWGELAKPY
jgi:hypothetical protein